MKATLALDDALVDRARRCTGLNDVSALMHEALEALIERESARHLAQLGGTEPDIEAPPRRQRPA